MDSVPRTKLRWKSVVLFLVLALVGLVLLVVAVGQPPTSAPAGSPPTGAGSGTALIALVKELSTVLLIGGTLGVLFELIQRRDFLDAIDERTAAILSKLELASQADSLGLTESRADGKYNFREMIEESSKLVVALNDGRTWVSTHSAHLKKRLADPSKVTTFFLVHPESPMVEVLAQKEGSNPEGLRHKLSETLGMLRPLRTASTQLTIFGHFLFNPHSVFLADRYVIVTPYFHSRGRRTVPAYRFDDRGPECFFREIQDDMSILQQDARSIIDWHYQPTITTATAPLNRPLDRQNEIR